MKRLLVFLFAIGSFSPNCFAEDTVNMNIVEYYREIKYINYECVLFTPLEFVALCKDSVGMEKLSDDIAFRLKSFENWPAHEVQEYKLLITMVRNNVINVKVTDKELIKSQKFIAKKLECFCIDTNVSSDFIFQGITTPSTNDFGHEDFCMIVFFMNNPIQYYEVINNHMTYFKNSYYFPLYKLQDCNIPIIILEYMKNYLLNITKDYDNYFIKDIYQSVLDCDVTIRCD